MFVCSVRCRACGSAASEDGASHIRPANQPATTVMRFSVSVPVLSEQMVVAPPMVSHAASTRTKLASRIILRMLRGEIAQSAMRAQSTSCASKRSAKRVSYSVEQSQHAVMQVNKRMSTERS